jgi:hypothetical protein
VPISIERKRAIAVYGAVIILLAAAVVIIIEYPEVLNAPDKPKLQILSRNIVQGRNDSGSSNVNASFTIVIKNTGTSNDSKVLVCSVSFKDGSNQWLTCDNRTLVTLIPGETRTYYPVVILPESAKSVSWSLGTVFE